MSKLSFRSKMFTVVMCMAIMITGLASCSASQASEPDFDMSAEAIMERNRMSSIFEATGHLGIHSENVSENDNRTGTSDIAYVNKNGINYSSQTIHYPDGSILSTYLSEDPNDCNLYIIRPGREPGCFGDQGEHPVCDLLVNPLINLTSNCTMGKVSKKNGSYILPVTYYSADDPDTIEFERMVFMDGQTGYITKIEETMDGYKRITTFDYSEKVTIDDSAKVAYLNQ